MALKIVTAVPMATATQTGTPKNAAVIVSLVDSMDSLMPKTAPKRVGTTLNTMQTIVLKNSVTMFMTKFYITIFHKISVDIL